MNTIPTVGPDTAIAPRSGSGSPQTPPQQRADAAPAILADSIAKADPGVMLKLVAPVLSQEAQTAIRDRQVARDPLNGLIAYLFGPSRAAPSTEQRAAQKLGISDLPEPPENASSEELLAWFASLAELDLDPDALVAARAMAVLKRLAPDVQEAIRNAPNPSMARLLRFAALTEEGFRDAPAQIRSEPFALGQTAEDAAQRLLAAIRASDAFALVDRLRENFSPDRQFAQQLSPGSASQPHAPASQLQTPASLLQAQSPLTNESAQRSNDASAALQPQQELGARLIESGLKDALRLLMDGRILWHGVFTPEVPARFERGDAWQTNRDALGGMEKGTSFRAVVELPNLGRLELRALGFGSQISIRLSVPSDSEQVVTQALPSLQQRLQERRLTSVQVALEPR